MKLNDFSFKINYKQQIVITLFVLNFICNSVHAVVETNTSGRIIGSQITAGQSFAVADNKYPNVDMGGTAFVNYSVGKVSLGIDYTMQTLNYSLNSYNFNYNVVLKITYVKADMSNHTTYQTLNLNYTNSNASVIDKSFAIIKGAHLLSVVVDHFETPAGLPLSSPIIPSNLYLEAEIETERFYPLNVSALPVVDHQYLSASNELEIYWNSVYGAEEYELEWTYVNAYDNTSTVYDYDQSVASVIQPNLPIEDLNFTFLQNSTRIRTSKNSFKIGLNYNAGMIVYRVRTIGKDPADISFETIGNWTTDQLPANETITIDANLGGLGTFNDYYEIVVSASHEENKNWQYTATYAEGGKKKEVVSYYDGSYRNRQTVTKTNTEDISIVAETIYDSQGRGAVQILPTPTSGYLNIIKYFENFNQSQNNVVGAIHVPYSKVDIEAGSSCPNSPDPLYTVLGAEGASVYYSEFNSKKNENQHAFIPDAEKYPYSTTIFTPDNTSRVKRQSGVGAAHKIGTDHETVYMYGDPDQEDLDKLFGSEAGYAERYKKNLVIDPNGQISVSYLNTENKVVATALAGNSPGNVNSVNSTSTYSTEVSYFDSGDDNYDQVNKQGSNSITFGKKIVPTVSGPYTFTYNLIVPKFTDTCIEDFCYDCAYNLDINILDECGTSKYSNSQKVGFATGSTTEVDYTCETTAIEYTTNGITPPFNVILDAGKEYTISKTLTINNDAMLQYLKHYMDTVAKNNTCLKTIKNFTASPTATVNSSGCEETCLGCVTKVEAYYTSHSSTSGVPANEVMTEFERDMAIKECMKPCNEVNLCEVQFENLLQDVRANGQYGEYKLVSGQADASDNNLSLFNDQNKLPLTNMSCRPTSNTSYTAFGITYDIKVASYKNPEYYNTSVFTFTQPISPSSYNKNHYFNADGSIGKVRIVADGTGNYIPQVTNNTTLIFTDNIGQWTYPENLAHVNDFINNYIAHPEWALSLVKYHPEFNYYLDCSRQTNPKSYSPENPVVNCKRFDSLLMSMDTYLAADAVFNFSSLADSDKNDSYDLLNADPYFNTGAGSTSMSSSLKTTFQTKLTNYAPKPGSPGNYMTVKEVAASMFSTANMHYSTCTGTFGIASITSCGTPPSAITPVVTITAAQLNDMWRAYRNMYLAEKNKIITTQSHINAVATGIQSNYYNGAIGDPDFNEWNAYHNYSFFPFFPYGIGGGWNFVNMLHTKYDPEYYPNCTTGGGLGFLPFYYPTVVYGYYDFGSPSSFYHKDKYAHKSRRFMDEQGLNNNLAGGASDPESVMANLISYANNEIQLNSSECPVYKHLELFLTSTFNNGKLLTTGTDHLLVNENSFTRDLYDKLLTCISPALSAENWHQGLGFRTSINATTKVLTIEFYEDMNTFPALITGADITLIPPGSGFVWADLEILSSIHFAGTSGGKDNFTIMGAVVTPPSTTPTYVTLTGTSGCLKSVCESPVVYNCKPTQQAIELQQFLNAIAGDYNRTTPSATLPLDLGNVGNYSSQNFTALVRYPFGNTVVTSGTHSVSMNTGSNQILLTGLNTAISSSSNVDVTFYFTPVVSGDNLTNVIGFTGLLPKQQNEVGNHDFSIKAIYGAAGSLVYKKFNVSIIYISPNPGTYPCNSSPTTPCSIYNLSNCDENVSSTCLNNERYETGIDLFNFMKEVVFLPTAGISQKPLNTIANYSALLKNQIGASANTLTISPYSGASWSYNSSTGVSTSTVNFSFLNVVNGVPHSTLCVISLSLSLHGDITTGNANGQIISFGDFKVIDPITGAFKFDILTNNGNDFLVSGNAPCLNMEGCEPCTIMDTVFKEDFDLFTSSSSVNFDHSWTDASFVTSPIPFAGMTVCPTNNQFSILSHINAGTTCYGSKSAYDHTKTNSVRNYLPVHKENIIKVIAYQKTLTNLEVGKQYELSAYIRQYIEGLLGKKINLVVNAVNLDNSVNGDVIVSTLDYYAVYGHESGTGAWHRVSGLFTATSPTMIIKLAVAPINPIHSTLGMFIDDIMVREKQCETPPLFIPPVGTPPVNPCASNMINIQNANAHQEMVYFLNGMKQDFIESYTKKCLQSIESMKAQFDNSEGHYTLYYYDQAGNLIKTVPPEGVETLTLTSTFPGSILTYAEKIKSDRANHVKTVFTNHRLATRYEYNSLNQLIRQNLPDHSATEQWTTPVNNSLGSLQTIDMDFSDNQNGYMTATDGLEGYILNTQDGGKTWLPVSLLGLADMIDFEVDNSTSTAYVITSDGNLLTSTTYNTSSPTWNIINLPNSNLLPLSDIEFIGPGHAMIVGENGLVLELTGGTWNVVTLPVSTLSRLTKITHMDDGSGGKYIVITGENGELFYKMPSGSIIKYYGINSLVDINDCSILSTGDGLTSFMNLVVCGKDKSGSVHKAVALHLGNINTTDAVLYPNTNLSLNLASSGISSVYNTRFMSLAANIYTSGSVLNTEVYLGGVTESLPPKPLLVKVSSTSTGYTNANVYATTTVNGGISKVVIKTPNNGVSSDIYGTLESGQLLKHVASTGVTTAENLSASMYLNNTAPLKGIRINPTNTNEGYVVGDNGTIIAYADGGTYISSQSINTISNPELNGITAAKDGSGHVYVVGGSGTIIHSHDHGNTWKYITTSTIPSGVNLKTALYVPGSTPSVILAGDQSYVGEMTVNNATTNAPTLISSGGTTVYKTIRQANSSSSVFVIGDNSGGVVSQFNTGATSLSTVLSGLFINDISFTAPNIAYAVGNGGHIYKSTDNGVSFPVSQVVGTEHLNRVVATDQLTAYALGENGTILKTTDGGLNWLAKAAPAGSGTSVNSVYNLGNNNIIVGGFGSPTLFNIHDKGDDYSSRFYYDALGRLIISQNSKQYNKTNHAYSYTIYDAIGRITQVGEISGAVLPDPDNLTTLNGIIDITSYNTWLTSGTKTEVTSTVYDTPVSTPAYSFTQENLRKRVSATFLDTDDDLTNGYQYAVYYNYDIHGNVKNLLNENPNLPVNHTCKKIDYTYDLISGKVNRVTYQKTMPDEFNHKYDYDADNRITSVYTSKEGYMWEQDAKYFYYLHGALARTEIGNEKVQGMDYAYTIQGWIKGINSGNLSQTNDIGKDGDLGTLYNTSIAGLNKFISDDAASYSLNYFNNDYKSINTSIVAGDRFYASTTGVVDVTTSSNWLYNGNISSMATTIKDPLTPTLPLPQLMTYKYDQLNRIVNANSYAGINSSNEWIGTSGSKYNNYFAYDGNGNIERQKRYNEAGVVVDSLTYRYHTDGTNKKLSNRLYHVDDAVSTTLAMDDIEDQGTFTPAPPLGNTLGQINSINNFAYDEIGNLVKDASEGIQSIEWTVYGKISKINRITGFVKPGATNPPSDLEFLYDPSGNRIAKIEKPRDLSGQKPSSTWTYTYYERDAQGNVMAAYEQTQGNFDLTELHIFGSSRLGMQTFTEPNNVEPTTSKFRTRTLPYYVQQREAGNRYYELGNHLGNVLSVVSDRKIMVEGNSTLTVLNNPFNGSSLDSWTAIGTAVLSNPAEDFLTIEVVKQNGAKQTLAVTSGQTYQVSFDLLATVAASLTLQIYNETSNTLISSTPIPENACWPPPCSETPVSYNVSFVPTDNLVSFRLFQGGPSGGGPPPPGSPFEVNIDNFIVTTTGGGAISYRPDIISSTDYYPFGSPMLGRTFPGPGAIGRYKYGFNGKENDRETVGTGEGTQDYGLRIYNPALGKFLSVDPLTNEYPELTPYQFASNRPIDGVDLDGAEWYQFSLTKNDGKTQIKATGVQADYKSLVRESNEYYTVRYNENNYSFDNVNDMKAFVLGDQKGYKTDMQKGAEEFAAAIPTLVYLHGEAQNSAANYVLSTNSSSFDAPIVLPKANVNTSNKAQSSSNNGVASNGTKKVFIDPKKYPQSAAHIDEAQAKGQPVGGVLNRAGADANRRASLKGVNTESGFDRDEYPPAILSTGGSGASVKLISPSDNRGAGASMGNQLKGVPDGTHVELTTTPTYNATPR